MLRRLLAAAAATGRLIVRFLRWITPLLAVLLALLLATMGTALVASSRLRSDLNQQYEMFGGGEFGTRVFIVVGIAHLVLAIDLLIPRWRRIGAAGTAILMALALVFTLTLETSPKPVSNLLSLRLVTPEITATAEAAYQECLADGGAPTCEAPAGDSLTTRVLVFLRDVMGYRPPGGIGYRVVPASVLNLVVGTVALMIWRLSRRVGPDTAAQVESEPPSDAGDSVPVAV